MNFDNTNHLLQAIFIGMVFFSFWHGYGIGERS